MDLLRRILNFPNKRTLGILFIAAIVLSIPITLTLLSQQQEIRQRAQQPEPSVVLKVRFDNTSGTTSVVVSYLFYNSSGIIKGGNESINAGDSADVSASDSTYNPSYRLEFSTTCKGTTQVNPVSTDATADYVLVDFGTPNVACTTTTPTLTQPPPQPPSPPTGLRIDSKGCNWADVVWNESTGAESYDVDLWLCNGSCNWSFAGTVTGRIMTLSPLNPNTSYAWQVTAKNTAGSSSPRRGPDFTTPNCTTTPTPTPTLTPTLTPTPTAGQYSVTGTVFIDSNKNKQIDPGENGFAGLSITISGGGLTSPVTISSGNDAFYYKALPTIGIYTLLVHLPTGYTLTTPLPNPSTFQIGESAPNADVDIGLVPTTTPPTVTTTKAPTQPPPPPPPPGRRCLPPIINCQPPLICDLRTFRCVAPSPTVTPTITPTATPTNVPTGQPTATRTPTATPTPPVATPTISPNEARVAIELQLPGIGPNTALGQNPNPVVRNHTVELQIFNSQNQKVKDAQGIVSFDPQTLSFKGTVSLGPGLQAGVHTIKARLSNTLWKSLGIVNIDPGNTSRTSSAKLISGDLDQNNELNLFDYNTMLSCYGANQCPQKTRADLNIDGQVDEQDLNILYAGFAKRQGD